MEFYKKGNGPSSSHTMGPKKAAEMFKKSYKEADFFEVILYGSLALTGKGHLTDYIIEQTLKPIETKIVFDKKTKCDVHPNTMVLIAYKDQQELGRWMVYSIGGGAIRIVGKESQEPEEIYKLNTFNEIKQYCEQNNKQIYDYVYETEGEEIKNFLGEIWEAMKESICLGLNAEGIIPGKLQLSKRAKSIYNNKIENEPTEVKRTRLLTAYAYAVSETNASGGEIVTAPTCGSCGVLPATLYYLQKEDKYTDEEIINALATAGIIGNIVKTNASISGAECGCQADRGSWLRSHLLPPGRSFHARRNVRRRDNHGSHISGQRSDLHVPDDNKTRFRCNPVNAGKYWLPESKLEFLLSVLQKHRKEFLHDRFPSEGC